MIVSGGYSGRARLGGAVLSSLVLSFTLANPAQAAALEPQVRLHLGVNYVGGPSPFGVSGGMDARLTRLIGLDLGGFVTPADIPESEFTTQAEDQDYYHMRHAVYFAPGLRIPHPQPRTWAWEFFIRGGVGALWYADTKPGAYALGDDAYSVSTTIGGFGGADAFLRFGRWGVRVAGRAWIYEAQHPQASNPSLMVQPQVSVEGLVQF